MIQHFSPSRGVWQGVCSICAGSAIVFLPLFSSYPDEECLENIPILVPIVVLPVEDPERMKQLEDSMNHLYTLLPLQEIPKSCILYQTIRVVAWMVSKIHPIDVLS